MALIPDTAKCEQTNAWHLLQHFILKYSLQGMWDLHWEVIICVVCHLINSPLKRECVFRSALWHFSQGTGLSLKPKAGILHILPKDRYSSLRGHLRLSVWKNAISVSHEQHVYFTEHSSFFFVFNRHTWDIQTLATYRMLWSKYQFYYWWFQRTQGDTDDNIGHAQKSVSPFLPTKIL